MNNFVGQWALKTLINTGESGIVYCMECRKYVGLTLTWDVLKQKTFVQEPKAAVTINFNMGCIETGAGSCNLCNRSVRINFNMGCIETQYMADSIDIQLRINFNMGCIETSFDV